MAVSADTVYQRVLALLNKEQRGYMTAIEYNLLANQAQLHIFENYFHDLNRLERNPGNNYQYADVIAVGPGLFTQTGDRIPMTCKVGNTVLLHGRLLKGDNEVKFENESYVLVRESEIAMTSNE